MGEIAELVRAFHQKFGFRVATEPGSPPDQIRFERAGLIAEEAGELVAELLVGLPDHLILMVLRRFERKAEAALSAHPDCPTGFDLLRVMREAADLDIGTNGVALNCGFDLEAATVEVNRANMTRSGPDQRGMAFKGPDFVPPDMTRVLKERGES